MYVYYYNKSLIKITLYVYYYIFYNKSPIKLNLEITQVAK